jgi:hypothetical protein
MVRVASVAFDECECVDENFSLFDLRTISCFAFLINCSSSCKKKYVVGFRKEAIYVNKKRK